MKAVFVDTGAWMACADRGDPALACTAARDATLEAGRILITTDFVVDETLTLIRLRLELAAANAWWQQIDGSARLRRERVENDRVERARNLFLQYRDKDQAARVESRRRRIVTRCCRRGANAASGPKPGG